MPTKKETRQFKKKQIVESKKYSEYRDFLEGNLDSNKNYTIEEVDAFISKHMKGKVTE